MRNRTLGPLGFSVLLALLPALRASTQGRRPRARSGAGPAMPLEAAPPPLTGHNLVYNGDFARGARSLPWNGELSKPAAGRTFVDKGELCMEVKNRGPNRWDAQLRHQHIKLEKGHTYTVQFKMRSSQPTRVYLKLGQAGPPFKEFWKLLFPISDKQQAYSGTFTMQAPDDPSVEMAFHLGGQLSRLTPVPFTVCLDDVRVDDPQYVEKPEPVPPPVPGILVNQVGYAPALAKIATVKRPDAVGWQLVNDKGQVVANGTTIPFGADAASGDQVSIADFTAYAVKGTGYTLKVGNDVSHPFDIRDDIYTKLKYDALAFFYQQRSGIAIEMPYAGDPKWAHPAGHIGVKPNYGDNSVPCATGSGCSYSLDVSGGWYDAGDHGKYVVNAGISVWTLLNYWERAQAFGSTRRLRRRQGEHPREQEQGPRPAGRGALGAGVRAQDAGARRGEAGRDGAPQDPRREVDAAVAGAARRSDAALPAAAQHGGDAEPGRERRAVRAHLADDRQGVRGEVPGRRRSGRGWRRRRTRRSSRPTSATAAGRTTTRTSRTTSTGRPPSCS